MRDEINLYRTVRSTTNSCSLNGTMVVPMPVYDESVRYATLRQFFNFIALNRINFELYCSKLGS